jgi:hypothetical protein
VFYEDKKILKKIKAKNDRIFRSFRNGAKLLFPAGKAMFPWINYDEMIVESGQWLDDSR